MAAVQSTLADRLLELTGAIAPGAQEQYLDRLQVERERGITVKAQTASLVYRHGGTEYLLNLIDTPGHVDFAYEVSRSLAACQGALLLVDAAQGVQAQTVANWFLAREEDLAVVPVLNKVDLPAADPARAAAELHETFDLSGSPADVLRVSAKTGEGLGAVLPAVIERVPPPGGDPSPGAPLRARLVDAWRDAFRGVMCLLAVVDGRLAAKDKLRSLATGEVHEVLELGVLAPEMVPTQSLAAGQVGYVITGMKSTRAARVGDTLGRVGDGAAVAPLPGFKAAQAMCFAGVFPAASADYERLAAAVERLALNDASVEVHKEVRAPPARADVCLDLSCPGRGGGLAWWWWLTRPGVACVSQSSDALGSGFRIGYLGLLHMEVFQQRLEDEHGAEVISTAPFVPLRILGPASEDSRTVVRPAEFPDSTRRVTVLEPTVLATVLCPLAHVGAVMELLYERRGRQTEHQLVGGGERALMRFVLPLAELAGTFYDQLKSRTAGYATLDYEEHAEQAADLVRLNILVNGNPVDALARVVPRDQARAEGQRILEKLRGVMQREQFEIALQAAVGSKILARETLKGFRKNVTAKCYGGDVTRKRKLLEKQKAGKQRLRHLGKGLSVPAAQLHEVLRAR